MNSDINILNNKNYILDYQLIIIDNSVIDKIKHFYVTYNFIRDIEVPILFMCYQNNQYLYMFKNILYKPFSIKVLEQNIIDCLY